MKIRKNYILHSSDDQTVLVAAGGAKFSGFVRGNEMLGVILEMLRSDTTEEKLIGEMRSKYNAPEGLIESDVKKVLEILRKADALEE
ncbi:MAG: PqqD family protein [Ruminococcus sp.]|nr:PqqD family protein [Ruminococcus sp.]